MPERHDRLIRCFTSVFPNLTPEQARTATLESISTWDSLACVTLVALLEEEFGIQIDISDLPELTSFEFVQNYLRKRDLL